MRIVDWLHKAEQHEATREAEPQGLEGSVIAALRTVYDPELPVNIYDLGLVYGLDVDEATGKVEVRMTLTAPGCPVAQTFPATVEGAVEAGFLDIDELAAERKDCLCPPVAALFGGTTGGVSFDNIELGLRRIALGAVGEFAGKAAA